MLTARLDSRYAFTAQYLASAARMARAAFQIELKPVDDVDGEDLSAHLGFVTAAVMQSVAALECDAWDIVHHGPGHHLGSNGQDSAARDFLRPIADTIDRDNVLGRFAIVLHLLRKPPLETGKNPWQAAALLVRLRNEITHYKSQWGDELERAKLFAALRSLHDAAPPFWPAQGVNFFPLQCLSAERAAWAVETVSDFFAAFYLSLGVRSPLEGHPELRFSPRP